MGIYICGTEAVGGGRGCGRGARGARGHLGLKSGASGSVFKATLIMSSRECLAFSLPLSPLLSSVWEIGFFMPVFLIIYKRIYEQNS